MAAEGGKFTVSVTKKKVVAAMLPLQRHCLQFSNLDLLLPPLDVGVFFCYKKPKITTTSSRDKKLMNFGSMVAVLKNALAQVLVSYYAFSGELATNSRGEPELLCDNRGVDFVEAFAEIELEDLSFYNPDDSIEGKLMPKRKNGVLAVQATKLKCGGLVVACTFDHRVADAYSANMFLVSWAEMAQSKEPTVQPLLERSLLRPRPTGSIATSIDNMYVAGPSLPPPKNPELGNDPDHLVSRLYYIKAEEVSQLQALASSSNGCNKRTKLVSFSAMLWKIVAKCAHKGNAKKITKMGIVVDGRTRLSDIAKPISAYFGNVISIPYGSKNVDEIIENPLNWVANEVHDFLKKATTKDHFLDLIDWIEGHRPDPTRAKIYVNEGDDGPSIVVSSGQRFPVTKMEFGWGGPLLGSYHFPWDSRSGYVMPMPSPVGNGDWIVYMHLLREQIEFLETEIPSLFRPLTWDYLNQTAPY